jgi:peptidoglycan-associated lipoprotein
MRCKILVTVLAGLALAACETTSEDSGSASGAGAESAGSGSSSGASPNVASRTLPTGPVSGTQEDLVTNVGDRVFFALDSYALTAEARATLEKQTKWLRQNQGVRITLEGHADERGTREYNLALGERRATEVRDYLVTLGVNPNRVKIVSYGKERPVDPSSTENAWSKNRRSVMVVR